MATNVTTEELQKKLEELAKQMGVSVHEYVQSQGFANQKEVSSEIAKLQGQISAITEMDDNGVESLAEKIKSLKDLLANEDGVVQGLVDKINAANGNIDEVKKALEDSKAALQKNIDGLSGRVSTLETDVASAQKAISDNKAAVDAKVKEVEAKIEENAEAVKNLTAGADVEGSIAKQIADEASRTQAAIKTAKETAVSESKKYVDDKIENLDLASNSEIKRLDDEILAVNSVLEDTTDKDGNLVKGIITRVKETENKVSKEIQDRIEADAKVLEQAKAYVDEMSLQSKNIDVAKIANIFVSALNGEATSSEDSKENDGEAL